jgi:YVTN family beta-propeller protein
VGTTLEFRVLGPVEATANSVPLELGGPKQRALLVLLLLRANEVVPRERLIDDLWADSPPASARDTIKVYVGRLRKIFAQNGSREVLLTRGGGYLLQIEPDQLDLNRFVRLAASGSRALAEGDAERAKAALDEAVSLWHGTPLVDLGDVPFARAEQARLEELRLAAVEERIEADLALGHASAVVPELRQLTSEHPYRERLHRQLMLALYRSGRQAEALAAYQDARTILVEQLGIEPSSELRDLENAILAHDPALEAPDVRAQDRHEPPAVPAATPTRRRGRLLVVGAAALVLAAAAIGAVAHTRADTTLHVEPNSVAIIDPDSNELVGSVDVGRRPAHIAAANGHVWVGNTQDDTLMQIDPVRRKVMATIPLEGRPAALVAGPSAVWVVTGAESIGSRLELLRVDPRFPKEPTARAELGTSTGSPRQPLALGMSTIWARGPSARTLVRRDPTTLQRRSVVRLGGTASAIAKGVDGMWATTWGNRLLRISPQTNTPIVEPGSIGSYPVDVAVGGNAVWIASFGDDMVARYNPAATGSSAPVFGCPGPQAVAFNFGSVWVACRDGNVWRIDPKTRNVLAQWSLEGVPWDMAAGEGAVWVTVYSELES